MRKLSTEFIRQINSQDIEGVFIWLLEVSHESFDTLYLTNDNQNAVTSLQEYTAFPFSVVPAQDSSDELPQASLSISNIGLDFITRIRSVTTPLRINLKLVIADDPNYTEIEISNLLARAVAYDDEKITYTLVHDDILSVQIPSYSYDPLEFRGLF